MNKTGRFGLVGAALIALLVSGCGASTVQAADPEAFGGPGRRGAPGAVPTPIAEPATTTLSAAETASLLQMREEEKLARDVYQTLSATWNLRVFSNIARSEQTHMDSVKGLLDAYGLADPAAGKAMGVFTNPELQALYNELVARGKTSLTEALRVGVAIEELDIRDLDVALGQTSNASIIQVYGRLRSGSLNHLGAFNSQLGIGG